VTDAVTALVVVGAGVPGIQHPSQLVRRPGVRVVAWWVTATGFAGAVRPFDSRWKRHLVALTTSPQDPLIAQLVNDLRDEGLHVPGDIADQLTSAVSEQLRHQFD